MPCKARKRRTPRARCSPAGSARPLPSAARPAIIGQGCDRGGWAMRLSQAQIRQYHEQGFLAPIRVLSPERAAHYRRKLEAAEVANGGPFQGAMKQKPHLLFTWLDEMVREDAVLEAVESVLR